MIAIEFQFLIGRLVTQFRPDEELVELAFQFLIGRLVTSKKAFGYGYEKGFNSS